MNFYYIGASGTCGEASTWAIAPSVMIQKVFSNRASPSGYEGKRTNLETAYNVWGRTSV